MYECVDRITINESSQNTVIQTDTITIESVVVWNHLFLVPINRIIVRPIKET